MKFHRLFFLTQARYRLINRNKIPLIGFYNNHVVLNYFVQLQLYLVTHGNKMTAKLNFHHGSHLLQ
jgi:hypothetical protein